MTSNDEILVMLYNLSSKYIDIIYRHLLYLKMHFNLLNTMMLQLLCYYLSPSFHLIRYSTYINKVNQLLERKKKHLSLFKYNECFFFLF